MKLIEKAIHWGSQKSPWVMHFNAGVCNGCDIEVVDALTPRFDLERVGTIKQGSPGHADILVCTGTVTLQTRDRLLQIYEQMPSPKFVVTIGACACTGGHIRRLRRHRQGDPGRRLRAGLRRAARGHSRRRDQAIKFFAKEGSRNTSTGIPYSMQLPVKRKPRLRRKASPAPPKAGPSFP